MHRELLIDCAPFVAAIAAGIVALRVLVRMAGAQFSWRRLVALGGDQRGGVESLAFVLTTPLFIIVLMFIVQLSQLAIGRVIVEYSAFAAARSAIVWIPANLGPGIEQENRIAGLQPQTSVFDEGQWYTVYRIAPEGEKYRRVHLAAAMACSAASPSRRIVAETDVSAASASSAMARMVESLAPGMAANPQVRPRLANKMAYALANTYVEIEVRHKESEPPLVRHWILPDDEEFTMQEIGWQDQITVEVRHDFALLPGPARILARRSDARPGSDPSGANAAPASDPTAARIRRSGATFVYPLSATARLGNEGQKPALPYVQRWRSYPGAPPGAF